MAKREKKGVTAEDIINDDVPVSDPDATGAVVPDQKGIEFVELKKKQMKDSQYRKRFDNLTEEIHVNLVNTTVSYGEKLYERSGWGSVMAYTKTAAGNTDLSVYPQKLSGRDQNRSGVPVSAEPIAFSKIIIAASVLGGKLPDATVKSDSKVYSKAMYELWRCGWSHRLGNGQNTLTNVYQNLFTYGWAAWRVYPRQVQTKRRGVPKILFDGIFREAMDPRRTWLGVGANNFDVFSNMEIYYEKDIPKDQFIEMYPEAQEHPELLQYCSVSQESLNENNDNAKTHVTISYYENPLLNRFVVYCGKLPIYDGEMPNEECFGSIVVVRCFVRDMNDPYGVGLYEMMRGNTAMYTYINSLTAMQVEAEISPIIFAAQVQNGTAIYKRGPNVINPKTPGTNIDVVKTNGNPTGSMNFADKQKENIEQNTGVNNIIAGDDSSNTLGATVILAEAARNRLVLPRNSVVDGLEYDALIANSWEKQTKSVDKIFRLDSEGALAEFAKQNPDYFVQSTPIMGDNDEFKGFMVTASPNLRLNFDFDEDGKLIEDIEGRKLSAKGLFDQMNDYGHVSPYINFIIDPNSMLLPSQEIDRQQYDEIYPIIQNSLTQIFALRASDPQAAASQLKAFETLLEKHRTDIFKYMSKRTYDEIMSEQLPMQQMAMMKIQQSMNPEAEGGAPGSEMTADGTSPLQPQDPEEMPEPQGALGSSQDASIGYAAAMPMTPGK